MMLADLISNGHKISDADLERIAREADDVNAARLLASISLPLFADPVANKQKCNKCYEHRTRDRRCRLSNLELSHHYDHGDCPAGKYPHQNGKKPSTKGFRPRDATERPFVSTAPEINHMAIRLAATARAAAIVDKKRWLYEFFDRVVVISLERTPKRLEEFRRHIESIEWPLREVEVFHAVDGTKIATPSWWREGGPAWGCLQSHRAVLTKALADGVKRLLILEDDVGFPFDLPERFSRFLLNVPDDWDCLMIGGQQMHDGRQTDVLPGVKLVTQCERTHCYALSRFGIESLLRWWSERISGHCDWQLGDWQATRGIRCYRPDPIFAYQRAAWSTLLYKNVPVRTWDRRLVVRAESICFGLCVYSEHDHQLDWCLRNVRASYPNAPVFVIADGVESSRASEYEAIAKRYKADFIAGKRLKVVSEGGQWWSRMFVQAATYRTDRFAKIDADTWVRRPLLKFPDLDLAGTVDGGLIQGGFQLFKASAINKFVESKIFDQDWWKEPTSWGGKHVTDYIQTTGQISTDQSLIHAIGKLGLRRGGWDEIDSHWWPQKSFREDAAVTHPHKIHSNAIA